MVSDRKKRRFQTMRRAMLRLSGIDVLAKTRMRDVAVARSIMANELHAEGIQTIEIAELMGKHRTTILYYLDRAMDILDTPGWEAENELWAKFKKEI